jgi:hypothetical protein
VGNEPSEVAIVEPAPLDRLLEAPCHFGSLAGVSAYYGSALTR